MDQVRRLRELESLAAIRRDAETLVLSRLRNRKRAVESQIEQLQAAAVERMEDAARPSAFQMSGRDGLWDAWRMGRIRDLSMQAAKISAEIEAQGQQLRRAVGRHMVLDKLAVKVAEDAATEERRREIRDL